jgi:hypothetical protein
MLRRIASFLFIAIILMSYAGSSSYARTKNRPEMKPKHRVVVVEKRVHRHRRHVIVVRRHRRRAALKVNVHL